MPLYTYRCRQCGMIEEHLASFADRDKPFQHEGPNGWDPPHGKECCGGTMERQDGLELPTVGKPAFQTQAVLGSGAHLKGHFGKEAVRRRKP